MEPENYTQEPTQVERPVEQKSSLHQVTPLSKYLAMVLFIILPFLGGYIGYVYAPEKVVEVEKEVIRESSIEQPVEMSEVKSGEASTVMHKAEKAQDNRQRSPVTSHSVATVELLNDVTLGSGPGSCQKPARPYQFRFLSSGYDTILLKVSLSEDPYNVLFEQIFSGLDSTKKSTTTVAIPYGNLPPQSDGAELRLEFINHWSIQRITLEKIKYVSIPSTLEC